ncbi:hypothetical protein LOTGIDRAFT_170441 [Lottia gigantea]|uniref:IQ domain-containing protein E n=1 Tax=Lottia gigantea TaxID=225164 RepID=V3ZI88_LOTGI|nr:hypothetical protein LOTGIDRAFT_170441 [Lottia gigantea]ESO82030.1 hypothetical protein LOTGIDRAFT_170441 [Lottia gigantea]
MDVTKGDDYLSPDDFEDQETLISRSKSVARNRSKSVPRRNTRKSSKRPGSPNKRPNSSLGVSGKTGHDLWITAIKKRQGALNSGSTGHIGSSPRHKTPIEYWVDTLRKTGSGISTESGRNTFTGLKKDNGLDMAYYSTSHHLRQVMGVEKPRKGQEPYNRSAAGTPAYKTPEEYYDEVLELRKQISNLGHDNSTMKAKVRRLEEDKIKKDKEMESLLNPSKSDDIRRTLGDRKPDSGAVIHSLKQKILKLEMQLREKDAAFGKLQGDLKVTKIDEMRCQMEVMYQEIVRLQNSKDTGVAKSARSTPVGKENTVKIKALNETILRLNKTNERLEADNRSLKEELEKATGGDEVDDSRLTGRDYEDMNRRQLLSYVKKMEVKVEKLERRAENDNLSILSLDKNRSNVPGKIDLKGSIEERLHQLDQRETELLDEIAKQKHLIHKLKEERSHYKQQCEDGRPPGTPGRSTRASPRRPSTRGSESSRPPTGRRRSGSDEEERLRQEKIESLQKRSAASNIQRNWRKHRSQALEESEMKHIYCSKCMLSCKCTVIYCFYLFLTNAQNQRDRRVNSFKENRAARKIQQGWAGFTHRRDMDDASYVIQGALKGHRARKNRLNDYHTEDSTEDESLDDAAYLIQSNVRGHMGRKKAMRNLRYDSTDDEDYRASVRRPSSGMGSRNQIGSRRSSRSPRTNYFSGQSNRSFHDDDDF